jgi:uncharacterized lipoprotein
MRYLLVLLVVLLSGCAVGHQTATVRADYDSFGKPHIAATWQFTK